jgi:hypothetical protein
MNISRGFRRLSIFTAMAGVNVFAWFWAVNGPPHDAGGFFTATILLVIAPTVLVLVLGWAVQGFRNSN